MYVISLLVKRDSEVLCILCIMCMSCSYSHCSTWCTHVDTCMLSYICCWCIHSGNVASYCDWNT